MIDGQFWRRSIFASLREALPFQNSSQWLADAYYPWTFLDPLLSNVCNGWGLVKHLSNGIVNSSGDAPITRWRGYAKQVTTTDVVQCLKSIPPDCFLLKGFHGADDAARELVRNNSYSQLSAFSHIEVSVSPNKNFVRIPLLAGRRP